MIQAVSGITDRQGQVFPGAEPGPQFYPVSAIDFLTGYLMAFGTMVALARRAREGGSWHVRISLAQTGRWLVSRGQVRFTKGEDALSTYTFNKHAIKHRFCANCGIHPFGEGTDPNGRAMAAINIRCVEGIDLAAVPVTHYDGRAS